MARAQAAATRSHASRSGGARIEFDLHVAIMRAAGTAELLSHAPVLILILRVFGPLVLAVVLAELAQEGEGNIAVL